MIVEKVREGQYPLFRPTPKREDLEGMDPVLVAMMTQCWAEQPSDRPSFEELTKQMRKLNDGKLVINFMTQFLYTVQHYLRVFKSISSTVR